MPASRSTNPVRERRIELALTQQEAARRAEVSVATWRRLETATELNGFKADNVRAFARALRLSMAEFHQLMGSEDAAKADLEESDFVRFFNSSFTGDPLTAADAVALHSTVAFSDFAPMTSKKFKVEHALGCGFPAFLKGEASIREVDLLRDLPELALTHVNNHWLVRMGERIMRVGGELGEGRVPRPVCLADEYALSIVIMNTDPPSVGDVLDMYPGLNDREHLAPRYWDEEDGHELVWDWRDRMMGALLPPDEAHDYRRHDLVVMEMHGQSVHDPSDPRHPLRWFDRDDLRERCESSLAYARLSEQEQAARTEEAMERIGN
ncbi:helix-turn-helix transcriptional regulator [Micromonospora sp. D93]|uniref:helix-turn-helix domain-containing protein n=1 Tax=Micromonospora sp. D93 TaxID=2824886 RepID=UPI001B380576|nr:helix-turn-helix transcriptional regulator [Micromonospora sp. D93]MBQ1017996.1 helix-turn-helix transcriptional regulator [Micromonospora sp. D93]